MPDVVLLEEVRRPSAGPRRRGLWGLARRIAGIGWRPARVVLDQALPVAERLLPEPITQQLTEPLKRLAGPAVGRPVGPAFTLRHAGRDLPAGDLGEVFPEATGRVVVLVPDAGADERLWQRGSERTGSTYGERLQALLGWTPVTLGHHAHARPTESGLVLSGLLQQIVDTWPVPVERLVLIAAGSGGLAVRAASAVRALGAAGRPSWTTLVTEVVALGVSRYAVEPARLASGVGKRLDEQIAGIVVADRSYLDLEPVVVADHLLVSERRPGPGPLGAVFGGVLWWRHRRGGLPRHVVDLFPDAEAFELAPGEPLTNRSEIHDALLRWLV